MKCPNARCEGKDGRCEYGLHPKPVERERFQRSKCSHCEKFGHKENDCWIKNPELMPDFMKAREGKDDGKDRRYGKDDKDRRYRKDDSYSRR